MNRRILGVAVLILSISCAARSIRANALEPQNQAIPHAETETSQSIAAQVDAYLKPYVDVEDFSGAVLIARRGRVLVEKAYGRANCELTVSNTPQTRFRIGSVSKQFTAAAVLLLEQRKLLSAVDPVAKFIPDFSHGNQITIHHLLTHTSGITGNMENLPEIQQDLQAFHSLAELAQMLKKSTPESSPGSKTVYSNKNYVLLAHIVEKVSGERFGPFLRRNIFDPLDMRDTGSQEYMEVVEHLATGYEPGVFGVEAAPIDDWWNNVGAGTIYSTVKDLYKWDRALYSDKLLTAESRKKMFTQYLQGGYGYGWAFHERFGHKVIAHNGREPGFVADISRYANDDAVTIVVGNIGSGADDLIRQDLAAILFGEKYALPEKPPRVSLDEKMLDQFVGQYEMFPGNFLTVRKVEDHLVLKAEGTPYSVLTPESDSLFFMRALYATVIFQKDAAGRVTGLIWRQDGDYPAKKRPPLAGTQTW